MKILRGGSTGICFSLAFALYTCCLATTARSQAAPPLQIQSPAPAQVVFEAPSDFNRRVFVVDKDGFRSMRFGNLSGEDQSRIRLGHPEQLPMPYLRSAAVGLAVPLRLERLLMIGLGGGAFPSFVQARLPEVYVDAVEIDPVVARIAKKYFSLKEAEKLRVHVVDAVEFVKQRNTLYDYIFLDAYDADELPMSLTTHRFFRDIRANLAPGGVVVVNIAISSDYKTRKLIGKLSGYYDHCLQMRSTPSLNDVLLLSDAPIPESHELIARVEKFGATGIAMRQHIDAAKDCT
ncbi:spermidine synthase [Chromatocurvus halotolerans]|uniref:Spermidine synthase n=1 Tax=Chromatocurvus halotolerans TaxID=1132028 RepID=A0A4R2KG47_9GAMM|nr:fused MFS/spermidine synthase [Chromatocurvus halotolerans]TCO72583.1 spermidine synthase [Chromatocurvus halotolerans]